MAENKVAEELRYVERYYTMRTPPVCAVAHIPTLVKEAAEEIERLEAENDFLRGRRWIPVTEQMPEEGVLIEATNANKPSLRVRYHPQKGYPDNPWEERYSNTGYRLLLKEDVTHWRPIIHRPIDPAVTAKLEPGL